MNRTKFGVTAYALLLSMLLPVSALADSSAAMSSIYGYAWRITNFVMGISAIITIADIAWHAKDMTEHGRRVKTGFLALGILGSLYGVAFFILGAAADQGVAVSGLNTAVSMKP
jgi:tryptophan-rich sensory protein